MKKTLLIALALLGWVWHSNAQIVITEIMYNPPESGNDTLEYIEFYNNSNAAVDLSNWSISLGASFTFPAGSAIQPGTYAVVAKDAAMFEAKFGIQPYQWNTGQALSNSGEAIELKDAGGNVIDLVDYENAAPWPPEANGNGASLVLCDPNADNSQPINWQAASTPTGIVVNGKEILANPAAESGCSGSATLSATNDQVVAASGETIVIAVLSNDLLPNPVTSLTISANPAHGDASVNPDNTIEYAADNGYEGDDEFKYVVCDADNCDTATVKISVKFYPVYTIAQVTTEDAEGAPDSLNVVCELQGTVYGVNLRPGVGTMLFTIIDDAGNGIAVSSLNGDFGYTVKEKDEVIVRGTIINLSGLTAIEPENIIKVSANNPLLAPQVVTTLGEDTESELIRFTNIHFVNAADWTTGEGTSGFNVRGVSDDHPNDTILIRIDRDVELFNQPAPPEPFTLTGIGGQFDSSTPFNSGYQILPRYNADISTLVGVKQADFSHLVSISPNPASTWVNVQMNVPFQAMRLYGSDGRLLLSWNKPQPTEHISVYGLPAGVYTLRFEKNGQAWSTQLVKN